MSVPSEAYTNPTGSILPHLLLWPAQLLALSSPRFPGRRPFFTSLILGLALTALYNAHFTNSPDVAQPFALAWANWMAVLEKFLSSDPVGGPEATFSRIDRAVAEAAAVMPLSWARLRWAAALMFNLRGVRWNYQVKNVPPPSRKVFSAGTSCGAFLWAQIPLLIYYYLMADLVNFVWVQLYYTAAVVDSRTLTIADPDWMWRTIKTLAWGPLPYYMINFQYTLFSIPAIVLGISKPEDWPPLFGSLERVTSVRRFWGEFWQQIMRRVFQQFSSKTSTMLGITKSRFASKYFRLWISFLMSAILHAQSNLISVGPGNINARERTSGMFYFFLWQAAAITFEDFMIWLYKTSNISTSGNKSFQVVVGWVWVLWSFWVSLPWAADVTLKLRFGEKPMLPFSLCALVADLWR